MQAWPLERKIRVTQTRITEWYIRHEGEVYVSFSGGKDSTVLLDMARRCYPKMEAVFVDTGLEYPEIREFVKSFDNVTWLYPVFYDRKKREYVKTNFKEVIHKYGYPIISKDVSMKIYDARINPSGYTKAMFEGSGEYQDSRFNISKYRYILDAPFLISDKCCDAMKKNPLKVYGKQSGKLPIVGTMASESFWRKNAWLKYGCNAFDAKEPISKPMSFWTEQDVLAYIKKCDIPYCNVYGEIIGDNKLKTTGEERTGCMFCMFGCHSEKEPNRFQRMKMTHPKQYDYCIRPIEDGGLGLGGVLDFIGVKY